MSKDELHASILSTPSGVLTESTLKAGKEFLQAWADAVQY